MGQKKQTSLPQIQVLLKMSVCMAINDATQNCNGSISAEHGIGRLKAKDLEIYTSKAKHEALKRIKFALDPNNIMNPGAVVA